MKKVIGVLVMAVLFLTSCTNIMNSKLNADDFTQVKEEINSTEEYSSMKKSYIIDNLSIQVGVAELGREMDMDESKLPTFKEQIAVLTSDFDSIRDTKLEVIENNKKLRGFMTIKDADMISFDKYDGRLYMTLDFDNPFDKEVLYIIFNYKYVNKYDSEFFNENTKLTDEVAGDFKGEVVIVSTEKYNDVSSFLYTKVPVQANDALRSELGKEKADEKVKKDFLMEGLKVNVLGVVFKDKTELFHQDVYWQYLDTQD